MTQLSEALALLRETLDYIVEASGRPYETLLRERIDAFLSRAQERPADHIHATMIFNEGTQTVPCDICGWGHADKGPADESGREEALQSFTKWFHQNYPGPDTIIARPNWHAPKIFRAVENAIKQARSK